MRMTRSSLALTGSILLACFVPSAQAGSSCMTETACNPGIAVTSSPYVSQPMGLNYAQPYDYLRTVSYNQTPQVNVLRVQTGAPAASLQDAPLGFWQGCGSAPCAAPAIQAPAPIMPAPVISAPVISAPVAPAPVVSTTSSHSSRVYGDASFVPGIVYAPTSYIERGTAERDAAVAATPVTTYSSASYSGSSYSTTSSSSSYGGAYVGDGWERVSGATTVDGMLATEILCKTEPAPVVTQQVQAVTQAYRVVRPIVAVPTPVPTPVPVACQRAPFVQAPAKVNAMRQAPVMSGGSARYGNSWAY